MTNEIHNPNEPAFPCDSDIHGKAFRGLTKRQYVAVEVLKQFIITKALEPHNITGNIRWVKDNMIPQCYELADAILNYDK